MHGSGASTSTREGASTDLSVIWSRLLKLGTPYWSDPEEGGRARWQLAGVVALTLGTTGVSVLFNFLGRDFFNALSEKDAERFTQMLIKWLGGVVLGVPVFVFRDYLQSKLALDWRDYMTRRLTEEYFQNRTFYQIQSGSHIDNPDQRISSDVRQFTDTALGFSMTILNAGVDLISFSGILYSIYPPLFVALLIYSLGGTATSVFLGRKLVGLNFQQEAQEANFRFGLVRVRENAESIAFYGGEESEAKLLFQRLGKVVANYGDLLVTSRNLSFFTSFYRFLIQILPAAVVAPLFFRGEIEFGVINQSSSAFNHILSDVSLVVYQFEALAGFSAIIDRLGEFSEVVDSFASPSAANDQIGSNGAASTTSSQIDLVDLPSQAKSGTLLSLEHVTLQTPNGLRTLVQDLTLQVAKGDSLLIVGPSGTGKTSLLRAIAGLWSSGSGTITRYGKAVAADGTGGDILFVPQRPYMVLGTLREQLLYPTWSTINTQHTPSTSFGESSQNGTASHQHTSLRPLPSDSELEEALKQVRLDALLERSPPSAATSSSNGAGPATGLDSMADWAGILSLGEQQRLAFARILLLKPSLVLMDEATSALDVDNEERLYRSIADAGVTFVSVGHRPTLAEFHSKVLRLTPVADSAEQTTAWEVQSVA
ncbi:g10013 [Coccomyxa elongata]